ncbi:MAG: insulinase family protein [Gammaproteobacteria bacterium]|nr:insulinase family protein [Gammaproteobacteria bacterium]
MAFLWLLSGLLLSVSQTAFATASHELILDNGLKVVVKEDHRAPVVVSQVWYKVGSAYEHSGITGISHALEHMMFKGTEKHPPGEFSRIIAENGGQENAFTGRDYTAYFQQLEASRLEISFELEADRMRNLTLPEEEFLKEIRVVIEERRLRTEDKPKALTFEQFNASAFVNSAYHHPVIGWMDDLESMTVEDLRHWYEKWYGPNNATLVVVGDVDPQQVFALAEKHFGALKPSEIATEKPRREITQKGIRNIVVKAPAKLPYLIMGYKVPVLGTAQKAWQPYALDVLSGVLDGGDSARFARRLVRGQQIAAGIGAGASITSRHQDLFLISGTPTEEHSIDELKAAIFEQIADLQQNLVSDQELERIKTQVVTGSVYEKDSIFYQAMQIGTLETVGLDWRMLDDYVDNIRAVTAEQIRDVANEFFIEDHLTVATLDPQPMDSTAPASAPARPSH